MSDNQNEEKLKEIEQENIFLKSMNDILKMKTDELQKMKNGLEEKIIFSEEETAELEQEKILLEHIKNKLSSNQQTSNRDKKTEVLDILSNLKQTSLSFILILTKIDNEELVNILKELELKEKIISLGETKIPLCNQCSFKLLESQFLCPKCRSVSFDSDDVLTHFPCSNSSRRATYEDDVCPQCNKPLKALGVDYKLEKKIYFCNQCTEKFQTPTHILLCKKCNTQQTLENTKWAYDKMYRFVYNL